MAIEKRLSADGSARWRMKVFIGREKDPTTGKMKRRFIEGTFDTKREAEAEERRHKSMMDQGAKLARPTKETLNEYLEKWLDAKQGTVRARTIHDYRSIVGRYITNPPKGAPPIGSWRLTMLTTDGIQALYDHLYKEVRLAPRTIHYLHTVLRMALKDAVSRKKLASNPTDHVTRKTQPQDETEGVEGQTKVVRAMTRDQASRFMEAAREDRYHALWLVLIMGGLRPSEALGLGWADVDLGEGKVYIHRTLTRVGVEGWKLVPTKTTESRRNITLPQVAVAALRTWKATQAKERLLLGSEYDNNGLVFTTEFGKALDASNLWNRNFRSVMKAAGLGESEGEGRSEKFRPAFRMYDLRHTHATLLLLAGESIKLVSERLGHASIVLTADTYSHVLPSMQQGTADRLDAMFGTA